MAQWRTDIHVSWRAQWLSLAFHGLVALALLLCPWPANLTILWLALLVLIIMSLVCSQRRIRSIEGELALSSDSGELTWQGEKWRLVRKPWLLQSGMLLVLSPLSGGGSRRLWVAADSMDGGAWRDLRRLILQSPVDRPRG
ncbi:toxin CptA [Salmonella enterica subsp. enterica serovar Choleraesuis]|nr:toxin CptA [Salmonella enterica subsp. enterica serovar Choleraesuis]